MNPLEVAWVILKDRGEPFDRLMEIFEHPDNRNKSEEEFLEEWQKIATRIGAGHDVTSEDVDRALGIHLLSDMDSEPDHELGHTELDSLHPSMKEMFHDIVDAGGVLWQPDIIAQTWDDAHAENRHRERLRIQDQMEDERRADRAAELSAGLPHRDSSTAAAIERGRRAAIRAARRLNQPELALDDDDWTPNPAFWDSHHGDERGAPRPMPNRASRRPHGRLTPLAESVPGLSTPLTAASQGEGRVGPDVMDERELMRYEAPQLFEMINAIEQEIQRREESPEEETREIMTNDELVQYLMTRLMAGETLSPIELMLLQSRGGPEQPDPDFARRQPPLTMCEGDCGDIVDEEGDCVDEDCSNYYLYGQFGTCEECEEPLDEDRDCVNERCDNHYENHW